MYEYFSVLDSYGERPVPKGFFLCALSLLLFIDDIVF